MTTIKVVRLQRVNVAGNFQLAEQRHNLAQGKRKGTHQVLEDCFPGIINKGTQCEKNSAEITRIHLQLNCVCR